MKEIRTERLRLVAADADLIAADRARLARREEGGEDALEPRGADPLATMLEAHVPRTWPPPLIPDALPLWQAQLAGAPETTGWLTWYWIACVARDDAPDELVGAGGFKGPPDDRGAVEIGYSLLDSAQGHGLAAEAVTALLDWAFTQPDVRLALADTFPDLAGSVRLLERLGFRESGPGADPGSLRFELRRTRTS
jgi:RimJ/RimL family protein N-acetyltransferase